MTDGPIIQAVQRISHAQLIRARDIVRRWTVGGRPAWNFDEVEAWWKGRNR